MTENRRRILNPNDPALDDFVRLTDVALRKKLDVERGLYLAESPKIITRAVAAGHVPRAILTTERWLETLGPVVEAYPELPVHIADEEMLENVTGFHLHRGAIASMQRPQPLDPHQLMAHANTVVVLDNLSDHTNVGAIFRSAAALGADAVLLTPDCADPLYRRSVRVSMGAVLEVPWARLPRWQETGPLIRDHGFTLVGFGLRDDAIDLEDFIVRIPDKLALVFGAEGPGLSRQALAAAEMLVRIPMDRGIDSLNVATAAGIALWAIRANRTRST